MRMRRTKLSAVSAPGSLTTRFNNPRISRSTLLEEGTQKLVDALGSVRLYSVRRPRNALHPDVRHPARIGLRQLLAEHPVALSPDHQSLFSTRGTLGVHEVVAARVVWNRDPG